jgi:hypothetical protein
MAIPAATVRIQIQRVLGVPATTLGAGDTRYARCEIQVGGTTVRSGRSRPMPAGGGDFDLTPEAVPWEFEFRVDPGTAIGVTVDILEDRGDNGPPTPLSITAGIPDPWTSGVQTAGGGPSIEYRVTTTLITSTDAAFLARAGKATSVSGTLTVPQCYVVQIGDIAGLYKPAAIAPGARGSAHVLGYVSEDNLGRIFTNRLPNGNWAKDTQYIEAFVRVTAIGGAKIPAAARIKWTVADADDPTNDASDFHRDWGVYVDPNDYSGTTPSGAKAGDNAGAYSPGNSNESLLFGASARASRWGATMGGPAPVPVSAAEANSPIVLAGPRVGTCSVRVHCPNVLGTNLILKAELTGVPAGVTVHNAATGVMTMWSRLDVEVVRMAGAHSLAGTLPLIPPFFHPMCVQLDMQNERTVSGPLDRAAMATSERLEDSATGAWVDNPGVFKHRGTPGWFFLGGARFASPPSSAASPTPLYDGTSFVLGTTGANAYLEVPVAATTANYVRFIWTVGSGSPLTAGFPVASALPGGLATRILLWGNDITPDFTGHDADGSTDHAYKNAILLYPQHELPAGASRLVAGGFGVPASGTQVKVFAPGARETLGISPTVKDASGNGEFFAGRTVLFTHTTAFSTGSPPAPASTFNQEVLSAVVHEFLHAFGMPHKCGQWDWRTPRDRLVRSRNPSLNSGCCMNYDDTWLVDPSNHLIPGAERNGVYMCGRHLMEVRRVHLERNAGLRW